MAGKKDNTMVLVLTDMTDNQAAQMLKRSDVGNLLQSGIRKVKCCRIATREENL